MGLIQDIEDIRVKIKTGKFANEASVINGIVLRLLNALSWNTYDTSVVCPEYSLSGKRVDLALCHPPNKPVAFVEVKQTGQADGAERQLFEYAYHDGVPMAILTDGQTWDFFLPAEQGDYGERRVYKLDIVERDIQECVGRLERYLLHGAVASGAAIKAAREDYRNVARERQIKSTIPDAWKQLVEEGDEMLLEIMADKVEKICGYKPDHEAVAEFLRTSVVAGFAKPATPRHPPGPQSPIRPEPGAPAKTPSTSIGFTLNGRHTPCNSALDVLLQVFEGPLRRWMSRFQNGSRRFQNMEQDAVTWPKNERNYSRAVPTCAAIMQDS